jgi:hypothetical protein
LQFVQMLFWKLNNLMALTQIQNALFAVMLAQYAIRKRVVVRIVVKFYLLRKIPTQL